MILCGYGEGINKCIGAAIASCDGCQIPICARHGSRQGIITDTLYRCFTIDYCPTCMAKRVGGSR